jgi:hypothetical protein
MDQLQRLSKDELARLLRPDREPEPRLEDILPDWLVGLLLVAVESLLESLIRRMVS